MVPSQPSPSSALREYCWVARTSPRNCNEVTVPVGESDGRVSCLPPEICACSFWPRAMVRCRSASTRVCMLVSVTRLGIVIWSLPGGSPVRRSSTDQAGAVDQLVKHGIDGGEYTRGRFVPALVGQQAGHLLVEVDSRF